MKPRIDRCLMENQKGSAGQKSLSLVDMASAFIVFGIGMSSAILVFLLEVIYYKINKHFSWVIFILNKDHFNQKYFHQNTQTN